MYRASAAASPSLSRQVSPRLLPDLIEFQSPSKVISMRDGSLSYRCVKHTGSSTSRPISTSSGLPPEINARLPRRADES